MNQRQQLSAGQFAQLLNIDRHLLDRYDELGLFVPASRDKNGRRTYDLSQVNQWLSLQTIVGLERNLNTTKQTLQQTNDHVTMLKYQQKLIEQQLNQLSTASDQITQEITSQETAQQAMPDVAAVVERAPVNLLTTEVPDNVETLVPSIQQHIKHVITANAVAPVHIMVGRVHPKRAVDDGNPDEVGELYTTLTPDSDVTADAIQPGGRYIITYHHADLPLLKGFEKLAAYAHEHQLSLGQNYYEEPVVSSWQTAEPSQQVVRLLVEVKG